MNSFGIGMLVGFALGCLVIGFLWVKTLKKQ